MAYYTEKACSVCGTVNWDSIRGGYKNKHELIMKKSKKSMPCDTNGTVMKWDQHGNVVHE